MVWTSLLRLDADLADQVHPAGVAVPAVEDRGDVDVDDVAVLERAVARNAVADDMVDRGAAALRIAAIAERRGDGAGVERHPVDDVVQLLGGDAGDDMGDERVEDVGGEPAGGAHAGKAFGPVQLDRAVAADDAGFAVEEMGVHGPYITPRQVKFAPMTGRRARAGSRRADDYPSGSGRPACW